MYRIAFNGNLVWFEKIHVVQKFILYRKMEIFVLSAVVNAVSFMFHVFNDTT